jgi:pentatricopeptide repeat protein
VASSPQLQDEVLADVKVDQTSDQAAASQASKETFSHPKGLGLAQNGLGQDHWDQGLERLLSDAPHSDQTEQAFLSGITGASLGRRIKANRIKDQWTQEQTKKYRLGNAPDGSYLVPLDSSIRDPSTVEEHFRLNHEILVNSTRMNQDELRLRDEMISLPRDKKNGSFSKISYHWTRNYAALCARTQYGLKDLEPVVGIGKRRRFAIFARYLRSVKDRDSGATQPPTRTTEDERPTTATPFEKWPSPRMWPDFMMLTMRYLPNQTAYVLQKTYPLVVPPFYMITSVIDFIVRFCMSKDPARKQPHHSGATTPNQVLEMILDLVSRHSHERATIQHSTVSGLLQHLDLQQGYRLFYGLQSFNANFNSDSCITFADFFATQGEYQSALEALDLFLRGGGAVDSPLVKVAAAKLLRRSVINPKGYHDSGYIISEFMKMGLKIGRNFQNILISNSFDSKDTSTALDVFSLMREQGTEPDEYTYSAMLKGLRFHEDEQLVNDVLNFSWAKVEDSKSTFLAGEVLYWYYAQEARRAAAAWETEEKAKIHNEALSQLVSLYTRIYDGTPLTVLGFYNLVPKEAWSPSSSLAMQPDPFIMTLMILAYTRAKVLMQEAHSHDVSVGTNIGLYRRFMLVATRHDIWPEIPSSVRELFQDMLTNSPRTLNIFMHALGTQTATLEDCVKILGRMDSQTIAVTAADGSTCPLPVARPNEHTWNILLNVFARHGLADAAEKGIDTMQRKAIPVGEVSWNTLVKSHAVAQDPLNVMRALRRKEAAGFGMDEGILRTLRRLKDQSKLKAYLRDEVGKREDVASHTGARRVPWAPSQDEVVSYAPGVGKRQVQYFDANRTAGLHRSAWTGIEESVEPIAVKSGGGRILEGQGSFSLKSDDEGDWFEEDEDEVVGREGGFGDSEMDHLAR